MGQSPAGGRKPLSRVVHPSPAARRHSHSPFGKFRTGGWRNGKRDLARSACVSDRYPSGRRRLPGEGENGAGSASRRSGAKADVGRGLTPAQPGERDVQNPTENGEIK